MSLRKYLLVSILLILSSVGGLAIWSSYRASVYEVQELFDAQLSRSARLMLGMAVAEVRDGHIDQMQDIILQNKLRLDKLKDDDVVTSLESSDLGHYYELKLAFQVWDKHGNLILHSGLSKFEPLTQQEHGYSDSTIEGYPWRVFSMWSYDREYLVMAAERYDVRMELVEKIIQRLMLPFMLLMPVLAWLLWLIVGRGLQPIMRVAEDVKNRDLHNLTNIKDENAPAEIKPLVQAINRLFERVNESFDKEKRFTSDAAHELRTPLAALKTHAQLARSSRDEADRAHALMQVEVGVERASHVVEQLLTLARMQPDRLQEHWQSLDLHQLAVDVAAELAPQAATKNIDLAVDEVDAITMHGHPVMLRVLLRNLLDNAIRYSPRNGQVAVTFGCGDCCVSISDSGPGIAEADYEKVFERFYRGNVEESGCGIGLSIVKQVADMHGAFIKLGPSALGGLKVSVLFSEKI
ncbi:MAG: sensor histidine kinase N-terminal domain-containing protein [Gammaproteobacteria bacterium]|nr:sensor histidine kinase N-terminal domain-containing protein [Gammaproteobacteria bacterium]